jgi:hypothetical protein
VQNLSFLASAVIANEAESSGANPGLAQAGCVYITPGGVASADVLTVIAHNHAYTSNDDGLALLECADVRFILASKL